MPPWPFSVTTTGVMPLPTRNSSKGLVFAPAGGTAGGSGKDRDVLDVFSSLTGLRWQPAPNATTDAKGHFDRLANLSLVVPPIINMTAPSQAGGRFSQIRPSAVAGGLFAIVNLGQAERGCNHAADGP